MSEVVLNSTVDIDPEDDIASDANKYLIKQKKQTLTKKQQKFVQLYVYQDLTNTDCAHRAGYRFPEVVAPRLLHSPEYRHIQEKIRELQEGEQKKYEITFDKVARDLKVIRDAALEDGSYGAAVSAELGRAKLAGLMVERKEIKHGSIDQMDRSEVEARLRQLIDSNQLAPVLESRIENSSPDVESDEELVEEFDDIEDIEDIEDIDEEIED